MRRPVPVGVWALAGAGIGLLLSLGVVLLTSFLRHPLLSEEEAGEEFPADLVVPVHVLALTGGPIAFVGSLLRPSRRRWVFHPVGVVQALWRAIRAAQQESEPERWEDDGEGATGGRVCCVLVERRRWGDRWGDVVAEGMAVGPGSFFVGADRVTLIRSSEVDLGDEEVAGSAAEADTIMAFVSEGAPRDLLRNLDETVRTAGTRRRILVYLKPGRRWSRGRRAETRPGEALVDPSRAEALQPPASSIEVLSQGLGALAGDADDDLAAPVRIRALTQLLSAPSPAALETVTAGLSEPQGRVRALAVALLRSMHVEQAYEALLDTLEDPAAEVRISAHLALLTASPSSVAPFLVRALERPERRDAAAGLLAEMGERAADALIDALPTAGEEARQLILGVLEVGGAVERLGSEEGDLPPEDAREPGIGARAAGLPGPRNGSETAGSARRPEEGRPGSPSE